MSRNGSLASDLATNAVGDLDCDHLIISQNERPKSPSRNVSHSFSHSLREKAFEPLSPLRRSLNGLDGLHGATPRSHRGSFINTIDAGPAGLSFPANVFQDGAGRGPSADELPPDENDGVSSVGFIFSLWNTMVGSTILVLPYGFADCGPLGGPCYPTWSSSLNLP